jgi:flagellar export protein FliJ
MSADAAPRSCWAVLVRKARQEAEAAQVVWQAAQRQSQAARQHVTHLQQMQHEYQVRHQVQVRQAHAMGDHLNNRRFVAQLDALLQHALQELQRLERQTEQARQRWVQAQLALDKMEKMQDHEADRLAASERQRAQRQLDQLATLRYHWREP